MKKFVLRLLFILFSLVLVVDVRALDVNSSNAILYNLNDDEVLFEKNSSERVKIASLTKIMTAIVAIENIDNLNDTVVMPKSAFYNLDGYALSGLKAGEVVTYLDLLYGIMLPSGADCANAIAILTSGSVDNFVFKMNQKVQQLNLDDTHFSNPIGMDDDNYSTVSDVAMILKYALKNDVFYKIFTTRNYVTTSNLNLESTLITKGYKKNLDISSILGSKTGFTDEAGNCLASISNINNVRYLLVTTNADASNSYHIMDAINLYDYFSKNYGYKKILEYGQYLATINLNDFKKSEFSFYSDKDIYMYLNNSVDVNDIVYEFTYNGVSGKPKKGDYIGRVNIKYNDQILDYYDIFFNDNLFDYTYLFVSIGFILLIIILYVIVKINKNVIYKWKNI